MKKKLFPAAISMCLCCFAFMQIVSCAEKKPESSDQAAEKKIKPKRVINDRILIILGKDYYEKSGILNYVKNEYGIGERDSPVQLLTYKEMTALTKSPRLKTINEKIEEYKSTIEISLGIPEGGGGHLIQIAENNSDVSIISLLPMDEILPLEAASDIVADFKFPKMLQEKNAAANDDDIMILLTASIFAAEDINAKNKKLKNSPLEEFREALFTAQKVIGKTLLNNDYTVKPFTDPGTGIPSHTYLIIHKNGEESKNDSENTESDAVDENGDIINPDTLEGGA